MNDTAILHRPPRPQPRRVRQGRAAAQDIRHLGRILGDTVRAQEGEAVFERIEHIRQSSIRFRRDDDLEARRELEATLDALSRDQTLHVVRAFSYFSHLANIAEDQHHIAALARHLIAGSAPRPAASRTPSGAPSRPGSRRRRWPSSSPAPRSAWCSPPTPPRSRARASSTARWRSPACSMRATASPSPRRRRPTTRRRCAAAC